MLFQGMGEEWYKKKKRQTNGAELQDSPDIIRADRRLTLKTIVHNIGISKSSVQHILTDDPKMAWVCALWFPRLLTEDEMTRRVADSNVDVVF